MKVIIHTEMSIIILFASTSLKGLSPLAKRSDAKIYLQDWMIMDIKIRKMVPEDWEVVRSIYQEGIETGNATFETRVPDWEYWDQAHRQDCRFVALKNGRIVGWAALSPVSKRAVYAGVAEVSLYVASTSRNTGVGKRLMQTLIDESEKEGLWTLQASIFPENETSIGLHKRYGFRIVGYREKIAQMNGVWRDVVWMERRSKRI